MKTIIQSFHVVGDTVLPILSYPTLAYGIPSRATDFFAWLLELFWTEGKATTATSRVILHNHLLRSS